MQNVRASCQKHKLENSSLFVCLFVLALSSSPGFSTIKLRTQSLVDYYTFLGNYPPTPPLSQHFALREKWGGVGGQLPRKV